jgi:hypothetical protein
MPIRAIVQPVLRQQVHEVERGLFVSCRRRCLGSRCARYATSKGVPDGTVHEAGAHRIDVIERVKARLAELDSALPPGVEIVPTSPATHGGRPAR